MIKKVKNVLYMGSYKREYARNIIFINGMKKNNVNVYEHHVKTSGVIPNIKMFVKNHKKLKTLDFDIILLHHPTIIQLLLAKIFAFERKILIFNDIYISRLQTHNDYHWYQKNKYLKIFYRVYYYLTDFITCALSDYIILDTYSHIKFFHEKFNVPIKKFRRVYVGAQDNIFYPLQKKMNDKNKFIVGFWGSYIPLQGIKYIIKAAKIFEKENQITFILVGKGQTYKKNRKLASELKLQNIMFIKVFMNFNELNKLAELISNFDIGLGIFGETNKTIQVIPNKVFEGIAMKIPMITCESPAIKELFTHNKNVVLCKRANPESLAEAILILKNDNKLREKIRENAYLLFNRYCTIDVIGKTLCGIFNKILMNE